MNQSDNVPDFDPARFTDSTRIDNPYLPLKPGTTFVYEDKQEGVFDTVEVTRDTKVIEGVKAVVVQDTGYVDGAKVESTKDWFAQDKHGNVWYLGEFSTQFYPDDPSQAPTHEGSWQAGQPVEGTHPVQLARGGYAMEADPHVGDTYNQEFAPGVAEDMATVLSLHASAAVDYGRFDGDVLKTKDFSPLESDVVEHKFYVPGVGNVLTTDNEGAFEELVKIRVEGTSGNDTLSGYAGGDVIKGYQGNDSLYGLAGDDRIMGGDGNDVLYPGAGDNTLTGGRGRDAFVFLGDDDNANGGSHSGGASGGHGQQVDVITDYSKSEGDTLVLAHGRDSVAAVHRSDDGLQLTLKGGAHEIRLSGVESINDVSFASPHDHGNAHGAADDWLLA
jgi:hypothetical protein